MRYVEVNGARVSAIGVGTWQFGSKEWGYGPEYARTTAAAIVNRALDLGVNLVDTAEIYGMGASERILGEAIASRREQVFVASKVFPILPIAPVVEWRAVESASRLGVSTIDLYQVHWPNPLFPTRPAMHAMRRLQQIGLVEHVGVSNFNLVQWRLAERMLGDRVLTNQVQYSLVARKPDAELVPWAQANDRIVIAYSPLAQGLLSARYDAENRPTNRVRSANAMFLPENLRAAGPLLSVLREVAAAHDATAAQIALAWTVHHPHVVAIPGASSVAQVESNAAAADITLAPDEYGALTAAAEAFHPTTGVSAIPALVRGARRS